MVSGTTLVYFHNLITPSRPPDTNSLVGWSSHAMQEMASSWLATAGMGPLCCSAGVWYEYGESIMESYGFWHRIMVGGSDGGMARHDRPSGSVCTG